MPQVTEVAENRVAQVQPQPQSASAPPTGTPWPRVVALALALAAVIAVLVAAFAWPAVNTTARSVPIGVVAPQAQASALVAGIDQSAPDAFEVTTYADESAARAAIEDQDAYGAIVVTAQGARVLTASAASPAVSQLLTTLASSISEQLAAAQGVAVPPQLVQVEDVVPVSGADPRGAAFTSSVLPLALGGILMGVAGTFRIRGRAQSFGFVVLTSVVGGLLVALVAGTWLDVLPGNVWALGGVAALNLAAVGMAMVGLASLLGFVGVGLVAATTMTLGNPLSAASSSPRMLPDGWSTLGQLLPPGAGASALRTVSYFTTSAATGPLLVLAVWALAGAGLLAASRFAPRGLTPQGHTPQGLAPSHP